jgi:hypothetical protein
MKVVRYIGKLIVFCLLTVFIVLGIMALVFSFISILFFGIIAVIPPVFILFNYFLPWLFKEEVEHFNKKEGEKQNG